MALIGGIFRRLEEARAAYQEVVKMDPRNQTAVAFLGVTCHLLGDIDGAIVKYHEVRVVILSLGTWTHTHNTPRR